MNLLSKYYDKDSIGGGIPDEVEKMLEEKFRLPTEKELGDFASIEDAISHMATQNLCLAMSKYGYSLASEKLKEKDEEISRLKAENERLRGEGDLPLYDLSKFSEEDKQKYVDDIVLVVAKVMLNSFIMLGLETHIAADVVNDTNGDKFKLSFVKQN